MSLILRRKSSTFALLRNLIYLRIHAVMLNIRDKMAIKKISSIGQSWHLMTSACNAGHDVIAGL